MVEWWGGWSGWIKWLVLAVPVIAINSSIFYVLLQLDVPPVYAYWLSVPLGSLPTYVVCHVIMANTWSVNEK